MNVKQIREVIRRAANLRAMLTGSGRDVDFAQQDVGPQLEAKIKALRELDIPARFKDDRTARDAEIWYCTADIQRWHKMRAGGPTGEPLAKRCDEGGPRHVWLGQPRCTLCSAPFTG